MPIAAVAVRGWRRSRPFGRRTIEHPGAAGGDEGDVGAAQAELGERAVVERVELIGSALARPPSAPPIENRLDRVDRADQSTQLPPCLHRGGSDGGVPRDPGTAMEFLDLDIDERRRTDPRGERVKRLTPCMTL